MTGGRKTGDVDAESEGVLYLAIGSSYVKEARDSLASLRQYVDLPAAIVTDSRDYNLEPFDHVEIVSRDKKLSKEDNTWLWDTTLDIDWSPFDRTLYLDTDTYVCGDISDIFSCLKDDDISVARVQWDAFVDTLPDPHAQQYNTGVLLYRHNSDVDKLFRDWSRI